VYIYNNSDLDRPFQLLGICRSGKLQKMVQPLPGWDARVLYENSGKTANEVCKIVGVGRRIFFTYLAKQRETAQIL